MPQGKLTLPVLSGVPDDDPWERPYLKAPKMEAKEEVSFPMVDIRTELFGDQRDDNIERQIKFLQTHGFTAIRHQTQLRDVADFDNVEKLDDIYFPEVQDLVKRVTGAKHVFITNSMIRKSASPSDNHAKPPAQPAPLVASRTGVALMSNRIPPARVAHLDYTPLGARQVIRSWRKDINEKAVEKGIIAAEDALCANHGVDAACEGSDHIIAEGYNTPSSDATRYAAFSVWRPLATVQRDPLAMLPARDFERHTSAGDSPFVCSTYDIKVPGDKALGGDFLRQLGMLKVKRVDKAQIEKASEDLKWYYIDRQTADEIMIVKFFDSLALGKDAVEAQAPIHGSPDVEGSEGGEARQSIEVRCVGIW
ncbi:hypothetical protein K461DRAFT_279312 [Myriangium duriaei CBS 260.36]|uniref:Uncharacterized protein n=1 Tax=Myriangium duriaei CBS 260.36 TaxID=1168546 RepID=A0A9P4J1Y9_9PEZI|nr:hypothetical protein K461DRAFT_279312 [Myriangium duriaei CBS 260.36]